jgi:hypothetical protein
MTQLSCQERSLKIQKVNNLVSSLAVLLSYLPSILLYKWLSCAEISELLTSEKIPLDIDLVWTSYTQTTKFGHLEYRSIWKANVRFYRLKGIESSSTLQDEHGGNWVLSQLPSSFVTYEIFLAHVQLVNDCICFNKIMGTKKCKALSEYPSLVHQHQHGRKAIWQGFKIWLWCLCPNQRKLLNCLGVRDGQTVENI